MYPYSRLRPAIASLLQKYPGEMGIPVDALGDEERHLLADVFWDLGRAAEASPSRWKADVRNPDPLFVWLESEPRVRRALAELFVKEPQPIIDLVSCLVSYRLGIVDAVTRTLDVPGDTVKLACRAWVTAHLSDVAECKSAKDKGLEKWRELLGDELLELVGEASSEVSKPLHERPVPTAPKLVWKGLGTFELETREEREVAFGDYVWEKTRYDVLIRNGYDVLKVQTYHWEHELYEGKERSSVSAGFSSQLLVDQAGKVVYIEQTDGELWISTNEGMNWRRASSGEKLKMRERAVGGLVKVVIERRPKMVVKER